MNIKLFTMIAATVCGLTFASCDDDDNISVSNLPVAIQEEFSTKYPNAQIEEWNRRTAIRSLISAGMVLKPRLGVGQTAG